MVPMASPGSRRLCARARRASRLAPVRVLVAVAALLALALASAPRAAASAGGSRAEPGEQLIAELGCGGCHADLAPPTALRERLPDLGSAGLRYRPAYLFAYLRDPVRRRGHLGAARMPDFHLHEAEAVALVRFLAGERREPDGPWPEPSSVDTAPAEASASLDELLERHSCLACHAKGGRGGRFGPALDGVGSRLRAEWMRRFLAAPDRFGVPDPVMPALLVRRDEVSGAWHETVPGARADLDRIVAALVEEGSEPRRELEAAWAAARERHPEATAEAGRTVLVALQCAACHRHPEIAAARDRAPLLAGEGRRVRRDWLVAYLAAPEPLRPLGMPAGSGSRMPDFRLEEEEVTVLADALLADARAATEAARPATAESEEIDKPPPPGAAATAVAAASTGVVRGDAVGEDVPAEQAVRRAPAGETTLSAFARHKARRLLAEQLPCLGCHRLGGEGGRIAPDLSHLSRRLLPAFVDRVVRTPGEVVPHGAMPAVPMPDRTRDLVVRYLRQNDEPPTPVAYPDLVATPPLPPLEGPPGRVLYLRSCAACHGATGRGDGPNAGYLPVRPAAHADAALLSARPDDVLFDGIAAGGAILGKSHRMPAWGGTLSRDEIDALVAELRRLCRCAGPEWSRAASASGAARDPRAGDRSS